MTQGTATASRPLHARPASTLSERASRFSAKIVLVAGEREANAKSVLSLMSLDVKAGDELIVRADGTDASEAVEVIRRVLEEERGADE